MVKNMKIIIYVLLALTFGLSGLSAQEKPYLSNDMSIARPALKMLVKNGNAKALMEVIELSNSSKLQHEAISALSAMKLLDNQIISAMLRNLEKENIQLLEGGTEQIITNMELKTALMNAVAKALKIKPAENSSYKQVKAFVAEANRLINKDSSVEPDTGGVNQSKLDHDSDLLPRS